MIEVEVKILLENEQYDRLKDFFDRGAEFLGEEEDVTFYYAGDHDLRIHHNTKRSKIVLKGGRIHDEQRRELEIPCAREDFDHMQSLFETLGYEVEIKWFRTRRTYQWNQCSIMLDSTRGYGDILEVEKMATEDEQDAALEAIKEVVKELGLTITPREVFDQKFAHYRENWKSLIEV